MFKINRKTYEKTMLFFSENKIRKNALKIIYDWLPVLIFFAYAVLLILAWFLYRNKFLKILFIPAGVFVLVTVLRKLINEPRPYERYGISSLFGKKTVGQSMPSRHTASAFIISMAILYVDFSFGITFLLISCLIAASRVLAGVHYVRDVLVGAVISFLFGAIFFF